MSVMHPHNFDEVEFVEDWEVSEAVPGPNWRLMGALAANFGAWALIIAFAVRFF